MYNKQIKRNNRDQKIKVNGTVMGKKKKLMKTKPVVCLDFFFLRRQQNKLLLKADQESKRPKDYICILITYNIYDVIKMKDVCSSKKIVLKE